MRRMMVRIPNIVIARLDSDGLAGVWPDFCVYLLSSCKVLASVVASVRSQDVSKPRSGFSISVPYCHRTEMPSYSLFRSILSVLDFAG